MSWCKQVTHAKGIKENTQLQIVRIGLWCRYVKSEFSVARSAFLVLQELNSVHWALVHLHEQTCFRKVTDWSIMADFHNLKHSVMT